MKPQPGTFIAAFLALTLLPVSFTAEAPTPLWEFNILSELGATTTGGSSSIAVGPDSTVYGGIGSATDAITRSKPGVVFAVEPDGDLKWRYDIVGGVIEHGPVLGPGGTIYVAADIYEPTRVYGKLFAIDSNGGKKWEFESARLGSPAIASDGAIWVTSSSDLFVLEPNGEVRTRIDHGSSSFKYTTFLAIAADDTVYAGIQDGPLLAYNPDGTLLWEFSAAQLRWTRAAIGANGTIYAGDGGSWEVLGGSVIAINPDGSLQWEYPTSGSVLTSPVIGFDGSIYAVCEDGQILALNPDGTLQWSRPTAIPFRCSPVVAADGTLYLPAPGKSLFAISSTGEPLLDAPVTSTAVSPVLTAAGNLYLFQAWDILAFDLGQSFYPSSWPMAGQNPGQTSRSPISPPAPVGGRPEIIQAPGSLSVNAGSELMLSVTASSPQPFTTQWRRRGANLPGETNQTLTFTRVALSDADEYSIVLSNEAGMVSSPLARLTVLPSPPQPLRPLPLSGWNLDVVRELAEPHTAFAFSDLGGYNQLEVLDGSSWFETGYLNAPHGLPPSRQIISALHANAMFELQPYDQNNVLKLTTFAPSATLTLSEPARYHYLSFLAAATLSGGGLGDIVLHFEDGSSSDPLPFFAENWNTLSPLQAITDLNAVSRFGPSEQVYRDFLPGFGLHQTDLDLAALGLHEKAITSLTFTKPGGVGRPYITGIFAVSGLRFVPFMGKPLKISEGTFEIPVYAVEEPFSVQASSDLVTWDTAPEISILPGGQLLLTPETNPTRRYYRITIPPGQ